jgi:hypothetical protein
MVLFRLGTLRFLFLGLNLSHDALPTWPTDTIEGTIIANGDPAVPPGRRPTYSYEAQCLERVRRYQGVGGASHRDEREWPLAPAQP